MTLRGTTLGQKLHRSLLLFLLLLGGATAGIMAYGVHRTQSDATQASEQGFQEIGKQNILSTARSEASAGVLQMEYASQIGNEAARFMGEANALGLDTPLTVQATASHVDPEMTLGAHLVTYQFAATEKRE